jgi:hypothetical protein
MLKMCPVKRILEQSRASLSAFRPSSFGRANDLAQLGHEVMAGRASGSAEVSPGAESLRTPAKAAT